MFGRSAQSEVRLQSPAGAEGAASSGGAAALDTDYLSCGYHAAMVACLGLTVPGLGAKAAGPAAPSVAVVGLGGGQLPTFLATHFDCRVHVRSHPLALPDARAPLRCEKAVPNRVSQARQGKT